MKRYSYPSCCWVSSYCFPDPNVPHTLSLFMTPTSAAIAFPGHQNVAPKFAPLPLQKIGKFSHHATPCCRYCILDVNSWIVPLRPWIHGRLLFSRDQQMVYYCPGGSDWICYVGLLVDAVRLSWLNIQVSCQYDTVVFLWAGVSKGSCTMRLTSHLKSLQIRSLIEGRCM